MSEGKRHEIRKTVSRKFFEKNVETVVKCPECGNSTKVLVSICTVTRCQHCGISLIVEFEEWLED